ncbi:MAG: metallophosphoesterase [Bacillota bacterium]
MRLVVLGDLHGRVDLFRSALIGLGLTDSSGRWIGGRTCLIQLGDLLDRGPDPLACLSLARELEESAEAGGGQTVFLLGNHELLALAAGCGSHQARLGWMMNGGDAVYAEWLGRRGEDMRQQWPYQEEFFQLFAPGSEHYQWLAARPACWQEGDLFFSHAGVGDHDWVSAEELNRVVAELLASPRAIAERGTAQRDIVTGRTGPLWLRDHRCDGVGRANDQLGVAHQIIGHSPCGGLRVSCDGALVNIDSGMVQAGRWTALEIVDGTWRFWAEGRSPLRTNPRQDQHLVVHQPVPVPPSRPPRYRPGQLVWMYGSTDKSHAVYFQIERLVARHGLTWYHGKMLTRDGARWSQREAELPTGHVEGLGRLAGMSHDVPGEEQ